MTHGGAFGGQLPTGRKFLDGPANLTELRCLVLELVGSQTTGLPTLEDDVVDAGEVPVPSLDLAQEFGGPAPLHGEVGLRRWRLVDAATLSDDATWCEPHVVDVVDDRTDEGRVDHRIGGQKQHHRAPELAVVEVPAEAGALDCTGHHLVAAHGQDLNPAQVVADGLAVAAEHELVGHASREVYGCVEVTHAATGSDAG